MDWHRFWSRRLQYSGQMPALLIGIIIFLAFFMLRLPFRAEFLVNWDSVNFALGTEFFSLKHHQPHPPGYIGYVALGWLLNHLTGDPNTSLTMLSVIGGAVAPAILFALGSHFMERRYAVITSVGFGLSPIVWYYSEVALSYSTEMMLALLFVWLGYVARLRRSRRALLAATLFLSLLGAVRQSGLVLLLPLWLYFLWPFSRPRRIQAASTLVVANLIWFVPLMQLAGGPLAYLDEVATLAGTAIVPTSIVSRNLWGLVQNIVFIALGFLIAINFSLIIVAVAYRRGVKLLSGISRDDRRFFYLWLIPALLTFMLVHAGQLGYILLVLPAVFLLIGVSLSQLTETKAPVRRRFSPLTLLQSKNVFAAVFTLLVFSNVATFFGIQEVVYVFSSPEEEDVRRTVGEMHDQLPVFVSRTAEENEVALAAGTRQFSLKGNDDSWGELLELIHEYDSETTAILTAADGTGSFRHLTYYLPEYRVYAIGEDRRQFFGHLFTSYSRTSTYSLDELKFTRPILRLPEEVERLIIPDSLLYEHLDETVSRYEVVQENGNMVVVATVPGGAMLSFIDRHRHSPMYGITCLALMDGGDGPPERDDKGQDPALITLLSPDLASYRHPEC